jgi:DNA-binding transcriptional LysR family regulator
MSISAAPPRLAPFLDRRVKLRHLELVVAITVEGTLQRAADRLNISQPAASKLISEIEMALGCSLFDRTARGLVPNRFAEPLVRHAQSALLDLAAAGREIKDLQLGKAGQTKVGAVTTPALEQVAPAAAALRTSHPGIQILIEVGTSQHLVEQVRLGRLDFALARIPSEQEPSLFDYRPMSMEPMCIIARRQHELASQATVRMHDLVERDWVLPLRGTLLRRKVESLFLSRGLPAPERVIESESFDVGLTIVLASNCLMVASDASARLYAAAEAIVSLRLDQPFHLDEYGLIRMRGRPLTPASEAMYSEIHKLQLGTEADHS